MTEQAIIRTNTPPAMILSQDPNRVAERLKLMVVNGKQLQNNEALALAQYAISTGLNPFLNECYYIPGVGPGPGIAGWRRKASEQLDYEAKRADLPIAQVWASARPAEASEASFDPSKGDIAYVVTLHDSISRTLWEKRILSHYIDLLKNGLKDDAWEIARELAGPEPEWVGVGVVFGSEKFSYDNKPEKFDRHERAKKRGEKLAIRKRFNLNLPAPVVWEEYDVIDADVSYVDKDEAQQDLPKQSSFMTYEMAITETNRDGITYGKIATDTLAHMANSLQNKLDKNQLTPEEREEKLRKKDACLAILQHRAAEQQV